jgi:hypothetical protein
MSFTPFLPLLIDQRRLIADCVAFFPEFNEPEIRDHYRDYRKFHVRKNYEVTLGEVKTLAFEEAFILYLALFLLKPAQFVEIGSQHGKSARRVLDIVQFLNLPTKITCIDIENQLQFVTEQDVNLMLHDVADDFDTSVLAKFEPTLIHLDAHPYHLTRNALAHFLRWSTQNDAVLTLHDCAPGLYNPDMTIPKEKPELITSHTGHWERHVLADVFDVEQIRLDDFHTESHRLRIFRTRHGLAAIRPNRVLLKRAGLNEVGDSNQKEVPSPFQGEG